MTIRSTFFVFVALIASGSLIAACRGGQFTAPRQKSSDGEPTPDRGVCTPQTCKSLGHVCGTPQDGCGNTLPSCGVCAGGDICVRGTCSDPGHPGTPYGHVVPSDVGNTIGVGVVAPIPTAPYTGPYVITTPDTVIENVVLSGTVCPEIHANSVTLRNVIVDCSYYWAVTILNCDGCTIEYSKINNSRTDGAGKGFRIGDSTNVRVHNNEITGGQDFFWIETYTTDLRLESNYMHSLIGSEFSHADAFQWSQNASGETTFIRGNYIDATNPVIPKTDILFATSSTHHVLFENNFLTPFGYFTLRCHTDAGCDIRNNIYAQEFKTVLRAPGIPTHALLITSPGDELSTYECNRYEDGDFIEQRRIKGDITHVTTGCPSYTPP